MTETYDVYQLDKKIADALDHARISQKRVDQVADALRSWQRETSYWEHEARRERQLANDLRTHLRDRDAHIRNLEAQLRPLIVAHETDTDTERML